MIKQKKAAGWYQAAINQNQKQYNKFLFPDPIYFYNKELLNLKINGKKATALCPFHDDHNPSFSFYTDSGYFRCFACGMSGRLVDFCMARYGLNYQEALRYLSGRV